MTASRFPNNTLVTVLLLRVASELKNSPSPVAAASTVPVATSRSSARLPNAPITSAPPMQNTASPTRDRQAEQHCAGGTGKTDVRQRMCGERTVAHHDEEADQAGRQRHQGAADQRVAHERRRQNLPPIVLVAKRNQAGAHQMLRM